MLKPDIKEINSSPNLKITKGNIKFDDVTFSYMNTKEKAIKNINCLLKAVLQLR